MTGDLKDILSNLNGEVDQQLLLAYLSGSISANDRQRIEQLMAENPFLQDALEGLQQISNKKEIPGIVNQLNHQLHKNLKPGRKVKTIASQQWPLIAIIVIILLCVAGYYILHLLLR